MDDSADARGGSFTGERAPSDRARVLLEINNAVVSHLDLAQVLKAVSACLRREINHDFAALALYNPELHELRLHALDFPSDPTFLKQGQLIPLVGTPASLAFSSRKRVLRHRPDPNEFTADIMKLAYARGIKSGCAVPLICHDKIVGSMALASLRESAFTEDDAELLTQIGTQVAIAVDNAQNFEKTRHAQQQVTRERDRSRLLLEVNNAVVSQLNLSELFKSVSSRVREVMSNDSAFIALCRPEETIQMMALDLGKLEDVEFKEGLRIPIAGTPEEQAINTGRTVLIDSVSDLQKFSSPWVHYSIEKGIKSGCVHPLIAHGRTLGALGVVALREHAFSPEDAQLLGEISGQIAIAVENSLNFEATRQAEQAAKYERDRSQLLLQINNVLVSRLDLQELVKAISSSLQQVLRHDFVGLSLYDPETGKMFARALESASDAIVEGILYDPDNTVTGQCFKTGLPIYLPCPDAERFSSATTKRFFDIGIKTVYCVPVIAHGRKLGILMLASSREDALTEADKTLFQEVSKQVAIAAANALAVRDLEALKERLAQEKLYLEDEIRNELNFEEIVGQSSALKQVLKLVETVAGSDSTVLLLGETGTGKELIARAVHDHSRRKSRTFVKLNCAAIPTGLLESELFGHEKGAFTGAIAQKIGRLELADQGTLFLDEVGDIPVEIQPKLLRALQEREFERLGSTHTKKVNVRLVAATNRDLEKMIEERQFRGDLYYRLNVFPIHIPPLRERQEDIPLLVRYFAEKFARQMQKPIDSIPAETMDKLRMWHWPGNVRELENLIERAVILTTGSALQVPLPEVKSTMVDVPLMPPATMSDGDREHIIKILRDTGGVLGGPNGAASRLGMKRTTLQYKIKKLGITRSHWWPTNPPAN